MTDQRKRTRARCLEDQGESERIRLEEEAKREKPTPEEVLAICLAPEVYN